MKVLAYSIFIGILTLSGCFSSPPDNGEDEPSLHLLWEYAYDLDGGAPRVKPYLYTNMIITSGDIKITALNYVTGEQVWKTPFDFTRQLLNSSFGVSNDVITGSISDQVLAWNIETGESLWSVSFPDSLNFSHLSGITGSSDFFIAVGKGDNRIYKISQNGELEIVQLDVRSYETSIYDGVLYASQRDGDPGVGVFTAYDVQTMEKIWRFEPGEFGFGTREAPIVENGIVYTGTTSGPSNSKNGFFALNAQTGEELWRREGIFTYSAVLVDDYIYVNDAAGIYKLRKSDGGMEWYSDFEAGAGTAPIDYGYGYLYAPHSGTMHVVDAETGEIVYRLSPPDGSYFWKVTVGKGRVFAQSNRKLYAFAPWGYEEPISN
ncbi:MAG: PQQ-binding-like beta-propeller repeat protein [Balneolaceae bacterium]